ncbi:MAG: iron-sulfur cluster assembly scaffold protein [Planctomycetes bacterium]|nr:iron-sulfur cluster assembly scaffold protein [Planctomycetota bacterium]
MAEIEDIYPDRVMDHYEDPYHRGECEQVSHRHHAKNPICGDEIVVEMRIDAEGKIREAWFEGEGCCISQAAASMLMECVEGKTVDDVKAFSAEDMLELFGPRLTPNRQKCCLLSWQVLQTAIHSPIGDPDGGAKFGGPNLGEEQ